MKDSYPFREFDIDWLAGLQDIKFYPFNPFNSIISKTENCMLYLLALFNI